MGMIRRFLFKKGDSFVDISNRFRQYLISNITQVTQSIHFCCDRYRKTSMKADGRHNRSGKLGSAKVYEVDDCFTAPDKEFFLQWAKTNVTC